MPLNNLASAFCKQPRWLRISTYLIIAYLIYALMLGVLTPLLLQSKLPGLLGDTLGRNVSIEKIRINPFLLRIRISNFLIEEKNNDDPFFQVAKLEVDAGFWQSLLHLTPTIEHADIVKPYVHLARTAGGDDMQFNFSDIIDTLSKDAAEQEPVDENKDLAIPHIRLGRFLLSNGHVQLSDSVTETNIEYPKLGFALTDLDTLAAIANVSAEQKLENHYAFELETTEGGTVTFNGQFQFAPLEIKGNIELAKIALAPLWPLSGNIIEAELTSGLFNLYLDFDVAKSQDSMRLRAQNTQLTVSDLTIADDIEPKVSIARIHIDDLKLDSETQQVTINGIVIDNPMIAANFGQNGLDLQAILTPKPDELIAKDNTSEQSAPTAEQAPSTSPPWRVILLSFALNNGDVKVNETALTEGMYWRVFDVNATTGTVDTNFETPIQYTLNLGLAGQKNQYPAESSGLLESKGEVNVSAQQVSGSLDFNQFTLNQLQSYIRPYANVTLQDGIVGLSGRFDAGSNSPIIIDGQANVASLNIIENMKKEPLLKWQDMLLSGISYHSDNQAFSLKKVAFNKPYAKLIIDKNGKINITDIVVKNEAQATANESNSNANDTPDNNQTAPMLIRIDEISLLDGAAYFEDQSLTPRFASAIEMLNGTIRSLSSNADTSAKVDINGKIDGYAPVALNGEINPLIDNMFLDLNFSVNGAELTSVNPYSGTYMGHYIDKGLLSLDVNYTLLNNQLKGKNHLVIDQLTLGKATHSKQALSLPLGLAIALLQDPNGVIDLGMEVSGDLNNPSFGFGSIIFKALGNIITKAVTAPFSLLANLVGSDDELNEIPFTEGSVEINDKTTDKLLSLSNALSKRPSLRVNIEGTVNKVADAYALAEQELQNQLLELSGEPVLAADFSASSITPSGPIAKALTTLFITATNKDITEERELVKANLQLAEADIPIDEEQLDQALIIAMYNQIRNTIQVPTDALANLAEKRAKEVKTFLVNNGKVDANRLFLLNSRIDTKNGKSGVTLALEAN